MENYHAPVLIIHNLLAENIGKRKRKETYAHGYCGTAYNGMPDDALARSVARAQTGGVLS